MVGKRTFDLGRKAILRCSCWLQKLLLDRVQMSEMREVEIPQQIYETFLAFLKVTLHLFCDFPIIVAAYLVMCHPPLG